MDCKMCGKKQIDSGMEHFVGEILTYVFVISCFGAIWFQSVRQELIVTGIFSFVIALLITAAESEHEKEKKS